MRGGACFWRPDITSAIRQFPNPILIDLDGTLVEQGNREKVNPQAQEALTRAERAGSVFIVTSGLVTIDYLKTLGLAGDRTVLITRENYPEDTPAFALSEVQKYIAMQRSSGRNYNPADFKLEDYSVKHLAPLFMKKRPIPLIDDNICATINNHGILGLTLPDQTTLAEYQRHPAKEFGQEIIPDLLEAVRRVEIHYGPLTERLKAVFAKMDPTNKPNTRAKSLQDESGKKFLLNLDYSPPDSIESVLFNQREIWEVSIWLEKLCWAGARIYNPENEADFFDMVTYIWNGQGYLPFRSYRLDRSRRVVNFQEELESVVDWFVDLTRPDTTFTVHPYFLPRSQFQE